MKVALLGDRQCFPDSVGLIRIDRPAADSIIEQARCRERPIAQQRCGHAKAARAGIEAVLGVARFVFGGDAARLAIGRARDDQPVQRLDAPATLAELDRQPIEQLAMYGVLALHAKILGGADDAGAEEMLPHPVDLHARGQRMFGRDEPLRQTEPILRGILRQRRQERRRGERDLLGRLQVFATRENVRLTRLGVAHHHDARQLVVFIVGELLLQFLVIGARLPRGGIFWEQVFNYLVIKALIQRRTQLFLLRRVRFLTGINSSFLISSLKLT